MDVTRRRGASPDIPCIPAPARSPVALGVLPVALPVVPGAWLPGVWAPAPAPVLPAAPAAEAPVPDLLPDWLSTVPVTSTRRFTSLFISPTLPVSLYVCCADMFVIPLPAEAPASEPVLPAVAPGVGFAVPAVLPVGDVDPVALPGRDPDIEEPLVETFVRTNSAPARLASPVREGEPAAVDPAVEPLVALAPPD